MCAVCGISGNLQQRLGSSVRSTSSHPDSRQTQSQQTPHVRQLRTKHNMCSVALSQVDKKVHGLICVIDIVKCALSLSSPLEINGHYVSWIVCGKSPFLLVCTHAPVQ